MYKCMYVHGLIIYVDKSWTSTMVTGTFLMATEFVLPSLKRMLPWSHIKAKIRANICSMLLVRKLGTRSLVAHMQFLLALDSWAYWVVEPWYDHQLKGEHWMMFAFSVSVFPILVFYTGLHTLTLSGVKIKLLIIISWNVSWIHLYYMVY